MKALAMVTGSLRQVRRRDMRDTRCAFCPPSLPQQRRLPPPLGAPQLNDATRVSSSLAGRLAVQEVEGVPDKQDDRPPLHGLILHGMLGQVSSPVRMRGLGRACLPKSGPNRPRPPAAGQEPPYVLSPPRRCSGTHHLPALAHPAPGLAQPRRHGLTARLPRPAHHPVRGGGRDEPAVSGA